MKKKILGIMLSLIMVFSISGTIMNVNAKEENKAGEEIDIIFNQDFEIKELVPEQIVDFVVPQLNQTFKNESQIDLENAEVLQEDMATTFSTKAVSAGRVTDYLTATGDSKIYQLDLQPGIYLQAQLSQPKNAGLDYDVYILDASGEILSASEYYTNINGLSGTLPEAVGYITGGTATARYYIYVNSSQGGSINEAFTLEYSVSNACDNYEIDENAAQALAFTFGIDGAYINSRNLSSPIDNDWYLITIPENRNYDKIRMLVNTESSNTCGMEVYKNIASSGFKMQKQNLSSNQLSVSTGTYYVRILNQKTIEDFNDNDIKNYVFNITPILRPDKIIITDLNGTEGLNKVVNYGSFGRHFRTETGTVTVSGYVTVTDNITGIVYGIPYISVDAAYYNPYWDANQTPDFAYIENSGNTDSQGRFNIGLNLPKAVGANTFDSGTSYHYFDDCLIKVNVSDKNSISDNETIFHLAYTIWHPF